VTVTLDEPMRGVAAGQSLVIYQGTRVLGQATITR
jgi:tRNA-specific 2-thiouridylase